MKNPTLPLLLAVLLLAAGCSDQDEDKAGAGPAAGAPAAPAVSNALVGKDVPAEIKDAPFENGGTCSLDVVNNALIGEAPEVSVNRADGLLVDGWAIDEKNGSVPAVVVLQLAKGEERYFALLNRHGGRDDLAKAYAKPEFANAAYGAPLNIAALPAGQYDVSVIQKAEGRNQVCAAKRKLNLQD